MRSDRAPGARLRSISATWLLRASVTAGVDPSTVTRMMEPVSPLPCPESGTDDTAAAMAADAAGASIPSASTVRSNAGRWATGCSSMLNAPSARKSTENQPRSHSESENPRRTREPV